MSTNSVLKTLKPQIDVISTHIIKPDIPTHYSLKHYNFSPVDQFAPKNYIPIVFYYPNLPFSSIKPEYDIATRLKHSLSESLVHYYRFSGRVNSLTHLDCNDEGVEFQEVNIQCRMDEVVHQESLSLVFPDDGIWGDVHENSPLLVVRLSNYICRGVSIAICLSHKLGDAKTFQTFMTAWAKKTRHLNSSNSDETVPADLFPQIISHPALTADVPELRYLGKYWATERFVFPHSKLTRLKETVSHESGIEEITSFEILTALLTKCAVTANTSTSGFFTPSTLVYPMNIRQRMLPPLPEYSAGNYFWLITSAINGKNENNLSILVEKIKKGKMGMRGIKTLDGTLLVSTIKGALRENYDVYYCSSFCKMQFYQADFGWGNPSRVAIAESMLNNSFVFMDTPNGDGIEALVTLSEKSMTVFREAKDILEFASME